MARRTDDPFDDIVRELERLMASVMGSEADGDLQATVAPDTHVGVHEYDDRVTVIADLPGVPKEDLDVALHGNTLSIRARGPPTRHVERVAVPSGLDATAATATLNNGVLTVELGRADDPANIDVE